ncbi:MAG: RNA polymerase sporulation sigma factor SigK [Clostridiales bacterium]|jgi:RNA polymerase sporulation-specific sigma factor|nr:RNA polymerase sporulation sigma factor SigK [Clostridiales bacterium]
MDKLQAGGSFPKPLNSKEEAHFIQLYTKGNPKEKEIAQNTLIERNLRLVAHIVKKFHHPDVEDLISIGTIGLIKGIYSFNPEKGVRLATYASRCIENEIRMHLRASKKYSGDISMQDSASLDREGNKATLEDRLADDSEPLEDVVALRIQVAQLYDVLELLDERERIIITMRYGLAGTPEITQREIGDRLNISRSYVSRIEKKALDKLSREFRKN